MLALVSSNPDKTHAPQGKTVFNGGKAVVLSVAFPLIALPLPLTPPLKLLLPLGKSVVIVTVLVGLVLLPLLLCVGVGVEEASGNVDGGIANCASALVVVRKNVVRSINGWKGVCIIRRV
jgi:hypothetical protein